MEEQCVAVESALNYPLEKSAPGAEVLLRLGVDAPGMTLGGAVLRSGADRPGGGALAAVAAGLFQETDADIGLSPETRPVSAQDHSHGQGAVLGPPKGNKMSKNG